MPETIRSKQRIEYVKIIIPLLVLGGLFAWLLLTPPGFFGKLNAIGYSVCHQIPGHSFTFFGRQMPLCSRCTGMYIGALAGLCFLLPAKRRALLPAKKLFIPIGILSLLFVVDGVNSFMSFDPAGFHLYTPQNWLRLLTGTGLGLAIPLFLVPVFNLAAWKDSLPEPSVASFKQYFLMLVAALSLDLLILVDVQWIRFLFVILSLVTLIAILIFVYAALWIMVIKREANFTVFGKLWPWLVAGLVSALLQVALMDILRYSLTGTWQSSLV